MLNGANIITHTVLGLKSWNETMDIKIVSLNRIVKRVK